MPALERTEQNLTHLTQPPRVGQATLLSLDCKQLHTLLKAINAGEPVAFDPTTLLDELIDAKILRRLSEIEVRKQHDFIANPNTLNEWICDAKKAFENASTELKTFQSEESRERRRTLNDEGFSDQLISFKRLIEIYFDKKNSYDILLKAGEDAKLEVEASKKSLRLPAGAIVLTSLGEAWLGAISTPSAQALTCSVLEYVTKFTSELELGLREASCASVQILLSSIKEFTGRELDLEVIGDLKVLELVEVFPRGRILTMEQNSEKLPAARQKQHELYVERLILEEQIDYLEHQVPGAFSRRTAQIQNQLTTCRERKVFIDDELEHLGLSQLESEADSLKKLVDVGQGWFIKFTPRFEALLEALRELPTRSLEQPFSEFLQSCYVQAGAVQAQIQRFELIWNELELKEPIRNPAILVAALSNTVGSKGDLVVRLRRFARELAQRGWDEEKRYRVATILAARTGDYNDILAAFEEHLAYLINVKKFNERYSTLYEAARMIDIAGESLEEKFERFQTVRSLLGEHGWKRKGAASCLAAINLATSPSELRSITLDMVALQRGIEQIVGRTDRQEAGFAALVLSDFRGGRDNALKTFESNWQELQQRGYEVNPRNYEIAALLCLVPGTAKQKVDALIQIGRSIKQFDSLNLTAVSAALLFGAAYGPYSLDVAHKPESPTNFKRHLWEGIASVYADRCGGEDVDEKTLAVYI